MVYMCPLDIFMLQMVYYYDGLYCLFIINIYRFIIFIVLTWMGPLMYFCDGLMGCEYSFLVDLDTLRPLVQLVFIFRRAQDRYAYLGFLAADLPGKNGNKAQ